MLDYYELTIVGRMGEETVGYSASFDSAQSVLRYAPRPGAPLSAAIRLAELRMARPVRPPNAPESPADMLPDGRAVRVSLVSGEVIVGRTRPISIPGGIWIRPDGRGSDTLIFIPDSSTAAIDFIQGAPSAQMPPPPVGGPGPSQVPPPAKTSGSAWDTARKAPQATAPPADERSVNVDPFEAATIGEFTAFDPSKYKPPGK